MATIQTTPSTPAPFMGNPIVVTCRSDQAPDDAAFHRVMLKVEVSESGSSNKTTFELSQPVSGADPQTVDFDISSCFRAAADKYEFHPVAEDSTYPIFSAKVDARDVWVKDGQLCDPATAKQDSKTFAAVIGSYSDYERHTTATRTFTRKPTHGELVCNGDTIVYAALGSETNPSSKVLTITGQQGTAITQGDTTYYITDPKPGSTQFQFLNSRGCVESIRAWGSSTEKAVTTKTETSRSIFERFRTFSRTYLRTHPKPTEYQMSSGFVSYEWARWWAYEFCQAKQHWMLYEGQWIPCHIIINDSLTIIDRTQVGMCYVEFTVRPDMNGPLW